MAPVTRSQTASARSSLYSSSHGSSDVIDEPPHYVVDLSSPPRIRYRHICRDYKEELQRLTVLFAEILALTPYPRFLDFLARKLLKQLKSSEETEEIRGIAQETGVGVHLVVAYNTFLDLFSGCISGAVRAEAAAAGGHNGRHGRMLHFRGLDWDMEELRKLVISVDYLRDGVVVARAITYAGYTGTLTGVREGLSISFNYRARLDSPSSTSSHRLHQILLLLGYRASIPSVLRRILLSPGPPPNLSDLAQTFPSHLSSPGYVTFCSPDGVLVIEKDLKTAVIHHSPEFLAVTNHDKKIEGWTKEAWEEALKKEPDVGGIQSLLQDSVQRKDLVAKMFHDGSCKRRPGFDDVRRWLTTQPILNETTHFSCIMDPVGGRFLWARAYDTPVRMDEDEDSSFE